MVKQLTNNANIMGSNPAPAHRRDKIAKQCFCEWSSAIAQWSNNLLTILKLRAQIQILATGVIELQNNGQSID